MKNYLIYAPALLLAMSASCSSDDDKNGNLPDAEPIVLRNAEKVATDNAFAFELFRKTVAYADGSNVFISPLSVSMALNMALNGAAGETAAEMKAALQEADFSMDEINEYSKTLREALLKVDPSTTIGIANAIWYNNGFAVKDAFVKTNETYYDAMVKSLDFSSPSAVETINGWCSDQTNGKIPEVIDHIGGSTRSILINAVYFKGVWKLKFNEEATLNDAFYREDGTESDVKMMSLVDEFSYAADESAGYLQMPYGNNAFSMVVMLPHEGKTTQDVIDNLNNGAWNNLDFYEQKVAVRMPRFQTECSYEMQKDILPALGMKAAFTGNADFSNLSEEPTHISMVLHKTFLKIDEEGTEAAAVTAVMVNLSAAGPMEEKYLDFYVNKPFLFAIRENSTGAILFIGKIAAP